MIIAVYDSERLTEKCKKYIKTVVGGKRITYKTVDSPFFLPKKYDYSVCLYNIGGVGTLCSIYKRLKSGYSRFIDEQVIKD